MNDYKDIGYNNRLQAISSKSTKPTIPSYQLDSPFDLNPGIINFSRILYRDRGFTAVVALSKSGGAFTNIQSAINYVNNLGGGRILITSGNYALDSSLILYSNISLIGEDQNTTILDFTAADADTSSACLGAYGTQVSINGTFTATNNSATIAGSSTLFQDHGATVDDVLIINGVGYRILSVESNTSLTLKEKYQGDTAASKPTRILRVKSKINISNLTITGGNTVTNPKNGIDFYRCMDSSVRNCILQNNLKGIQLTQDFNFNLIENIIFSNYNDGIDIGSSMFTANVFRNYVYNNGVGGGSGITSAAGLDDSQPIFITNNTFNNNDDHGIVLYAGDKHIINSNYCSSNSGIGILLQGSEFNIITGNQCTNNGSHGIEVDSLVSEVSDSNTLNGNICQGNGGWGILINTDQTNTIVDSSINVSNVSGAISNNGTGSVLGDNSP